MFLKLNGFLFQEPPIRRFPEVHVRCFSVNLLAGNLGTSKEITLCFWFPCFFFKTCLKGFQDTSWISTFASLKFCILRYSSNKYTWYTGLLFNRKQVDIRHIIYDKNTYLHKYINAQKYVYLICQTHLSGSDFTVTYLIEWFAYVM